MNSKQSLWSFKKRSKEFFVSTEFKDKTKIFKGSILSIIAGIVIAGIVIASQNVNPFDYLINLFRVSFDPLYIDQTMQWIAVYMIAGLSVAIGFKTGLFNIGVSGQMLAGAGISTIVYKLAIEPKNYANIPAGWTIVMFLICVFSGAALAGFAGLLKSMFNIHEVVSTIMLNWIVWYVFKFVFMRWNTKVGDGLGSASANMPTDVLTTGGSSVAIPLIIAGVCVVIVAILLAKTVFGFNLKAVGLSPTASKYAGINVKSKTVQAMAISGALAGVASFVNMLTIAPNVSFTVDSLPTVGYDAIAISLVAFNGAFGIVLVACLWGVIQSGGASASALYNLPAQMSALVFGIIVYFAAISAIFIKFAPYYWFKVRFFINTSEAKKQQYNKLQSDLLRWKIWSKNPKSNPEYSSTIAEFKKQMEYLNSSENIDNDTISKIEKEIKEYKVEFKQNAQLMINKIRNEISNFKTKSYSEEMNNGLLGFKRRAKEKTIQNNLNSLESISNIKIQTKFFKETLEQKVSDIVNWEENAKKIANNKFNKQKIAINVWKEGTLGDLKLDYMLKNGKIDIKGEYQKHVVEIKEEKVVARTDLKLAINFINHDKDLDKETKQKQISIAHEKYKNRISELNNKLSELKIIAKQKINDLVEKHNIRAEELRQNPQLILDIENEYNVKNVENEVWLKEELEKIANEAKERASKIDDSKATEELSKVKDIYQQNFFKAKHFHEDLIIDKNETSKTYIEDINSKIDAIVSKIDNSISSIEKVCGKQIFNEYDSIESIDKKTKILLEFNEIKALILIEQVIINNDFSEKINKKNNEKIIEETKNSLLEFKQIYKEESKKIKNSLAKNDLELINKLIAAEKKYNKNVEALIEQTTQNIYSVKGGN